MLKIMASSKINEMKQCAGDQTNHNDDSEEEKDDVDSIGVDDLYS